MPGSLLCCLFDETVQQIRCLEGSTFILCCLDNCTVFSIGTNEITKVCHIAVQQRYDKGRGEEPCQLMQMSYYRRAQQTKPVESTCQWLRASAHSSCAVCYILAYVYNFVSHIEIEPRLNLDEPPSLLLAIMQIRRFALAIWPPPNLWESELNDDREFNSLQTYGAIKTCLIMTT